MVLVFAGHALANQLRHVVPTCRIGSDVSYYFGLQRDDIYKECQYNLRIWNTINCNFYTKDKSISAVLILTIARIATKNPTMTARFQDQVILITGAASGIGRATTLKLAAQGASVAICDVNTSMLGDTESQLPKNTPILSQKVDVSSESDVISFVEAIIGKFGRLDHVFNCAGLNPANIPFEDTSLAYFEKQIGVNVKGVFLVTRESLKHLKRGASIVTVSSMSGTRGTALQGIYSEYYRNIAQTYG